MMKLEAQLSELAALGLALEPGVTLDDLLYSFDREQYEEKPFDLLLFILGAEIEREPWGRRFCRKVWNFDTECVEGGGAYVRIVENLAHVAGASGRISGVKDEVDLDARRGWVEYTLDGKRQIWDVEIRDDWADMMVVSYVMDALEESGRRFYAKDNGQAMVLFYLGEAEAAQINRLSKNALRPAVVR
jgi:hypothetical protein